MRGKRILQACWGFALVAGLASGAMAAEVNITSAQWIAEKSVLRIEGTADRPDAVILIRDAASRALIGSSAVRADGKWLLKIRDPARVPFRALAELGPACAECDVSGPVASR